MKYTFFVIILFQLSLQAQELSTAKKELKLMGCRFELTTVAIDEAIAWKALNAGVKEIERIENLISSWDENSQTSAINAKAGIEPVVVDKELYDLIFRSKKVSELTDGAFDVSFSSMPYIWKFDKQEQALPDNDIVINAKSKINWKNIVLNKENSSVFLKEEGMKIGFGAIGKGYAANRAKEIIASIKGVKGGLVNASGDLVAWGENGKSDGWKIQIADPNNAEKALGWIGLYDMAIVTSGDYEKYFTNNNKRYAHIINPKTGYPTTGIKSVSVICPDAELADALATSVFVLGIEKGMNLINQLNKIECLIIADDNNIHQSKNLNLNKE